MSLSANEVAHQTPAAQQDIVAMENGETTSGLHGQVGLTADTTSS